MAKQESIWPGQRFESIPSPSPATITVNKQERAIEPVPRIPQVENSFEVAGSTGANRLRKLPPLNTGWLEFFFRRNPKGHLSPLTRLRLAVGGLVLTGWSGYLTYIFMLHAFPAQNNLLVDLAPSLMLGLVETFLFVRGKSLLSLAVILAFEACDIYLNGVGFTRLLGVTHFQAVSDQGILISVVALGSAILPEMLIAAAAE